MLTNAIKPSNCYQHEDAKQWYTKLLVRCVPAFCSSTTTCLNLWRSNLYRSLQAELARLSAKAQSCKLQRQSCGSANSLRSYVCAAGGAALLSAQNFSLRTAWCYGTHVTCKLCNTAAEDVSTQALYACKLKCFPGSWKAGTCMSG